MVFDINWIQCRKKHRSCYKIDLKNVDFVNVNGELVSQSWDFTQRFFRLKNEESTIIKEYIDYFGDDYVKWKCWW